MKLFRRKPKQIVVDRFVCRREGHIPSMRITSGSEFLTTYSCLCSRCGRYVEFDVGGKEVA